MPHSNERHKARHLAKDSLAGGSGLGMLQTRRKHVSGTFLPADVSGSKAPLHTSKDTALSLPLPHLASVPSSDQSSNAIASLNEQSTPTAQQDGTANHIGENLPELPESIFDGELSAIRNPSMNLCELGNIYYDTSFDSVHFDVMGLACSPPQIAYESHGSSPSPLEPQAPLFRQRSRSVNFEAMQPPLSSITVEEPENHRQFRLQRPIGSPPAVLSNSALLPLRADGLQKRGLEVPTQRLDGITTERRVEGDNNVYTPREGWDLELLPVKRHEILNLLAEIRPIYPNGSPVDGEVAELSLDAMQEYIDLFLRYFNTSYPMVHIPTLDMTNAEPILLLSMITLGATYKNKDSHQVSVCLYDAIVPYILSGLMSIPIPDLSTL
ncbi:uncharacterized protein N7459_001047 [Penicillium hispanicum]|uniref:uncharacterized protein n=1 Tax=Penicillium hispanicum TaxID=1080232 RepID=UPI00254125E3|nr:uncharacterized protein N7459_001047 [Penicillium hispanicum]KAJ5594839.1 hypothetical protein N7459_001047 [Penicillium hispanicum]